MPTNERLDLQYARRFEGSADYRDRVWRAIIDGCLQRWVGADAEVLDLGCGWGEFIRNVSARNKLAMDLNPDAAERVGEGVRFLQQDCASAWPLPEASLDVVFSSNFLEHLPDKAAVEATLQQARRCLRPGGRLVLMGPNVRYVPGAYWDFWDHHVPLSDRSVVEVLELNGYRVTAAYPRFLPYTMSEGREAPLWMVRLYLALPLVWPLFGKQFLVVAEAA